MITMKHCMMILMLGLLLLSACADNSIATLPEVPTPAPETPDIPEDPTDPDDPAVPDDPDDPDDPVIPDDPDDPALPDEPPALHPGRGVFRHIDVLDYTRGLNWNASGSERSLIEQWLAERLDVNEGDPGLRSYAPEAEIIKYALDLTAQIDASQPPDEEAYLHFAEETVIQYRDLSGRDVGDPVTIPGCPPDGPPTAASRLHLYMWDSYRYAFDTDDPGFRAWQSARLLDSLGDDYQGLVLDEHSPGFRRGFYMLQNRILSGGAVRELDGLRSTEPNLAGEAFNAIDRTYSGKVVDWLAHLRGQLESRGKFMLINPAEYYWISLSEDEYIAAGGVTLEFVHTPFGWSSRGYGDFLERVRRGVDAGVRMDLMGRWCTTGPGSYTAGNQYDPDDRYRLWRLASYYLARGLPDAPGVAYFNPSFCNENATLGDFIAEWAPAYEFDPGDPLGDVRIFDEGNAGCSGSYRIYARDYSFGLVLVRPQDDPSCEEFGDMTAVEVALPEPLCVLMADGRLGPTVESLRIRNSEGVVLIRPTP